MKNRTADQIAKLNPDVQIVVATRHLEVVKDGKLVGILPHKMSREGLADNSKSQFRRAGIKLPGDKRAA